MSGYHTDMPITIKAEVHGGIPPWEQTPPEQTPPSPKSRHPPKFFLHFLDFFWIFFGGFFGGFFFLLFFFFFCIFYAFFHCFALFSLFCTPGCRHPPKKKLLLRMVRILLECILVLDCSLKGGLKPHTKL